MLLWPRLVFGPYRMKKFGNPLTVTPRYARAPPDHSACRSRPAAPVTRIGARNSVLLKPVA